ncbi:hypothetical protein JTB14_007392 [Gonioctena quinquepunctata]|nr:hypothetical protein JTB14_007392 [Gonioctena quinquepunctata]
MVKIKSTETLSLDTQNQKKVLKQTKTLKQKIQDGVISVKEGRKALKISTEEKRGLIFISHLPHGFYEDELRNYFKQFGNVTNVKVCRSRRTGNSKGFGYVEFANPEVAKIAAETMNNYLMFKKRVTAEFIPYEKRPKGLFLGKSSTPTKYSAKVRRGKQYQANLNIEERTQLKRSSSRIAKINKKLSRLQGMGIKTTFRPIDVTVIKQEDDSELDSSAIESGTHIYSPDPLDSEVEIKIPLKKSKKSVRPIASKASSRKLNSVEDISSKNKILLVKSLDSVKTILSPVRSDEKKTSLQNVATSDYKVKKVKKNKGGIFKKNKKETCLNADTIRKIARELIRKKGDSLLNYPAPTAKKPVKNKTPKK